MEWFQAGHKVFEVSVGLIFILYGIFVLCYNPAFVTNRLFFLFCLFTGTSIALAGIISYMTVFLGTYPLLLDNLKITIAVCGIMAAFLLAVCFPFMGAFTKAHIGKISLVTVLPIPYFLIMSLLHQFILDARFGTAILVKTKSVHYIVFITTYLVYLLAAIVVLVIKYRNPKNDIVRKQLRFILLGCVVGGISSVLFGLIPFYLWSRSDFAYLAGLFFLFCIGYSIVKYQAFSIQTAIHYTVFWTLSLIVFILPAILVPLFAYNALSHNGVISFIVTALFAMVYLKLMDKYIFPRIKRISLRKTTPSYDIIKAVSEKALTIDDVFTLQGLIANSLYDTIYAGDVIFLIEKDGAFQGSFHRSGTAVEIDTKAISAVDNYGGNIVTKQHMYDNPELRDLFFPCGLNTVAKIQNGTRLVGLLCVTGKRNLKPYYHNDLLFLEDTAHIFGNHFRRIQELKSSASVVNEIIHEIKNMTLGVEYSVSELLDKDALTKEDKERLNEIVAEMTKLLSFSRKHLMLQMIDQIGAIEKRSICLCSLIKSALGTNRSLMQEKNLRCEYDIQDDVKIAADETLLHIVFVNLIANAIAFSPDNSSIEFLWETKSGETNVSLIDHGSGMSDEHIASCANNSSPWFNGKRYLSSGLGLPLCRKIMKLHGGRIDICRAQGGGTRVDVIIPNEVMQL